MNYNLDRRMKFEVYEYYKYRTCNQGGWGAGGQGYVLRLK